MAAVLYTCYHGSEVPQLTEPSKNHLPRWFFRFWIRDYDDRRMISRKSSLTGYIQSKKVSLNMAFSIAEVREGRIGSLVITKELYDKLENILTQMD